MRKLTLADVVGTAIPDGRQIDRGGFRRYDEPGFRTHNEPGPHTHTVPEVFCIFQGSGTIEINGARADRFTAGDVLLIEPGEDHHLISEGDEPLVFSWMHLLP
ncbi:cupin domain-containing protein [Plantactinospora sp. KBS50]|uniref:cupin domain-containing protein n=1 Tax=Plantactinospora sp. KBS50 TaxID=2024580 RepID=UPI0018DFD24D|nr:cupin domain-containing protein [Plantactinospora sp. KBS50]